MSSGFSGRCIRRSQADTSDVSHIPINITRPSWQVLNSYSHFVGSPPPSVSGPVGFEVFGTEPVGSGRFSTDSAFVVSCIFVTPLLLSCHIWFLRSEGNQLLP